MTQSTTNPLHDPYLPDCDQSPGVGFSVPWDLHPKSLHAEFAHNTDLLLTLGTRSVSKYS